MLTRDTLQVFAALDTSEQVNVLTTSDFGSPLLDTEVGDKLLGYVAGHHPEVYSVLAAAILLAVGG